MSDWWELCWWAGGVLAALALVVVVVALFRDRSRGRRRCPKCWYDMSAVNGMTCPECGRTQKRERRFFGTRRKWRRAMIGTALLAMAMGTTAAPVVNSGEWPRYVPAAVLRPVLGCFPRDAAKVRATFETALTTTKFTPWERALLASTIAESIREELKKPPPHNQSTDYVGGDFRLAPPSLRKCLGFACKLESDARLVMPELKMVLRSGRDDWSVLWVFQYLGVRAMECEQLVAEWLRNGNTIYTYDLIKVLDVMRARRTSTLDAVRRFAASEEQQGRRLEAMSTLLIFGMYEESPVEYLGHLQRTGSMEERIVAVSILGRLAHSRDNSRVAFPAGLNLTEQLLRGDGTLRFPLPQPIPEAVTLIREATNDPDPEVRQHSINVLAGINSTK